jgi:hypothetical protein
MSQPYEIELVASQSEHDWHESMLATLTGLPKEEVYERLPEKYRKPGKWGGQGYVHSARALGYNCNPRFLKFDPATPWPCVLRVQVPDSWGWKGCWWALIYHQGEVYDVADGGHTQTLTNWQSEYPDCRITSMLQVWMSTDNRLLLAER